MVDEAAFFTSVGPDAQSFWRQSWRKITPFAIEPEVLASAQAVRAGGGQVLTFGIGKHADMAGALVLSLTGTSTAPFRAIDCVSEVSLRIGGLVVDRHPSSWLKMHHQQQTQASEAFAKPTKQTRMLPLAFSCCRHHPCALPLCALHDDVAIDVSVASTDGDLTIDDVRLIVDMVYLDDRERAFVVSRPMDMLMDQVQTNEFDLPLGIPAADSVTAFNARLALRGPLKALYFALLPGDVKGAWETPVATATLSLDGSPRFPVLPGQYWNEVTTKRASPPHGTYCMKFALAPETLQPSGLLGASGISELDLRLEMKRHVGSVDACTDTAEDCARPPDATRRLIVHAWSMNVLRIAGGKASLLLTVVV